MKNLKLTYKNGNEIILKDVTDYTVGENKLYYARYSFNGLVNQVVKMDNIVKIEEIKEVLQMTAKEFENYLEHEVAKIQKLARKVYPNEEEDTYLSICIDLGSNYRTGYTIDNKIDFVYFD